MVAKVVRYTDDGMGPDETIAAYLAACEVDGKSPRTVDAYPETIAMFRGIFLHNGLPDRVGEFGPAHVYVFLKVIAASGASLGTRHRRFRETHAFFSWCTRMGGCATSPFTGIPNVKVEQKVIHPLSEGEIRCCSTSATRPRSSAVATGRSSPSSSTRACATRSCTG